MSIHSLLASFFTCHLILTSLVPHVQASAPTVPKLSKAEMDDILKKGFVTKTKAIKDAPWPKIEIKAIVRASPLSSVAIFAAYDYQKNYIPNLIKSDVTRVTSPTQIQVSYELEMPWPLSNGVYTNDHKLLSPSPDHYQVSWVSVRNTTAEEVEGQASFLPFPGQSGATLMIYESRVLPKSVFAGILRKLMVKDVEKSIKATQVAIESLVKQKSTVLIDYENKILKALKGKNPY